MRFSALLASRFFSQSPTRHRLSRTSTGTFKCRTTTKLAPRPPHASPLPSRAALLPPASTACHIFINGGSTSWLLCAKPATPTQIDENEHEGPHVRSESQVVITTDTYVQLIFVHSVLGGSRGSAFLVTARRLCGSDGPPKKREIARVLSPQPGCCARLLSANQTHARSSLAVCGVGEAENRNVPNDTAALGFVENSVAAR